MTLRPLSLLGGALLFTLACGDSGGGTGTSSGSTSEGSSSTSSTSSTSASASTSGSATSTESGTTGEPTTGSTGGPGGDPTGGPSGDPTGSSTTAVEMTTGSTSSGSTGGSSSGGSTGGMMGACAMLGPNQCMANASCMAITGSKINLEKMCLQKPVFLQCIDAMGCGDALTIACPMGTTEPWQFPSTCIPDDYEPCDGMVLDMACK